ncbi:MAG: hypothetical protein EPO62_03800 [Candidatus Nitrosotenuis sp.]|nr:MAG: hypothetical protein EPO62_03800 [Candidatus Nitrosotenuis sp.]
MAEFSRIESSYSSKDACRLIWRGNDEDEEHVVFLNRGEIDRLYDILSKNTAGQVELEDEFSSILVNSDITQFRLSESKLFEVKTQVLKKHLEEFRK